ncbi:MAG: hypothetical protein Q4A32_05085, partial [Lachnospiraceae bacterium]|nr:hypothetical protein [Lachnospiraceae bacterium]
MDQDFSAQKDRPHGPKIGNQKIRKKIKKVLDRIGKPCYPMEVAAHEMARRSKGTLITEQRNTSRLENS